MTPIMWLLCLPLLAVPDEKSGWMSFAQQGASTGGTFASQGGDSAMAFMSGDLDLEKEGRKYQASGKSTQSAFAGLSRDIAPAEKRQ